MFKNFMQACTIQCTQLVRRSACCGKNSDQNSFIAMAAEASPLVPALPNVAPMTGDQQGMSPSTVVAATAADRPGAEEGATEGVKGQGKGSGVMETGVAVRHDGGVDGGVTRPVSVGSGRSAGTVGIEPGSDE